MLPLALLVLLSMAVIADRADALIMCAAKRPTGAVREGAPIKLRAACKTNEIQVDPIALGLQGPPGPPGGGAIARDSNHARVGFILDDESSQGNFGKAFVGSISIAGVHRPVIALITSAGFEPFSPVFYSGPGCTGTPLVRMDYESDLTVRAAAIGPITETPRGDALSGPGTTLFYPASVPTLIAPASKAYPALPAQCGGPGATFTLPATCCLDGSHGIGSYSEAAILDVGALLPPFRIETPQ